MYTFHLRFCGYETPQKLDREEGSNPIGAVNYTGGGERVKLGDAAGLPIFYAQLASDTVRSFKSFSASEAHRHRCLGIYTCMHACEISLQEFT